MAAPTPKAVLKAVATLEATEQQALAARLAAMELRAHLEAAGISPPATILADTKVSALSAVSAFTGAMELPVNDGGTSKKATGTQVRDFVRGLFVVKTADESVTSSAALQNDDHLSLALATSTFYTVDGYLSCDGAVAADIQVGFTVPSGATVNITVVGLSTSAASDPGVAWSGTVAASGESAGAMGLLGTGNRSGMLIKGWVRTAGTAGNLQLQWAQGTSNGTATTVALDSWLAAMPR